MASDRPAITPRPARHAAPDAVLARLDALERRLDALEAGQRSTSVEDAALLACIAERADGRPFLASDVTAWAAVDQHIADALDAAFLEGPAEIGGWLRARAGQTIGGLVIRRGRRTGAGHRWLIASADVQTPYTPPGAGRINP